MVAKKYSKRRSKMGYRGRKMKGSGKFLDFFKKVNRFLRKHKIVSSLGKAIGSANIPGVSDIAGKVGNVAGSLGYGRKRMTYRKKRGGALRLSGSGRRRR